VTLGAADTFRAAAEEQLEIWAERAGARLRRRRARRRPGRGRVRRVEAAAAARRRDRRHRRPPAHADEPDGRAREGAPRDRGPLEARRTRRCSSSTRRPGQNGLQQARLFGDAVGVTGVALTKLDGSAKGGIAIAIAHELGLPVKLVGRRGGARRPAAVRSRTTSPARSSRADAYTRAPWKLRTPSHERSDGADPRARGRRGSRRRDRQRDRLGLHRQDQRLRGRGRRVGDRLPRLARPSCTPRVSGERRCSRPSRSVAALSGILPRHRVPVVRVTIAR
jgi:hypothetical protein